MKIVSFFIFPKNAKMVFMKQYIIYTIGILFILGLSFYAYINNKVEDKDLDLNQNNIEEVLNLEEKNLVSGEEEKKEEEKIINSNQNNKEMTQAIFKTNKGTFTIEFLSTQVC